MDVCGVFCAAGYLLAAYIVYKFLDHVIRLPQIGHLEERYILVTGCDTGFGHEVSKKLDKLGCNVFAACLTEKGETELRKACSSKLKTVSMNVANPESVRKAFDFVKSSLPAGKGLHGLLNNAGVGGNFGPVEWLKMQDYRNVMEVNAWGLIDVTVTFLPLVKPARGRIVNTASVFGRFSLPGTAPYSISKYAVEAFSDNIRRQLRPFKVSVHLIEPGFHKTNITSFEGLSRTLKNVWAEAPQEAKEEYGQAFLDKSVDLVIDNLVNKVASDRIEDVVDAYTHALLGRVPRTRYVVGFDAKMIWLPVQRAPEWLGDWFLEVTNKDRPIPAACQK